VRKPTWQISYNPLNQTGSKGCLWNSQIVKEAASWLQQQPAHSNIAWGLTSEALSGCRTYKGTELEPIGEPEEPSNYADFSEFGIFRL